MPYRTVLLFGPPGSGKGTQGKILGAMPAFFHCACGDVFRSLDPKSEMGVEFANYSKAGSLVPDELTVKLWCAGIERGRLRTVQTRRPIFAPGRNPANDSAGRAYGR